MQLTGAVSNRRPAARAPITIPHGGRPDIPGGVWPWDANRVADMRPSLANVLNRLGYFQHVACMWRRLMLDHAVDDHPLDALDLVRHRNLEVVRQNVGHEANVSGWIIAPHLLKRFSTVLQPAFVYIARK
jgi:hypothetical protein